MAASGSLFDFGGGVNRNPAGGTTNLTGSTMPVGSSRTSGGSNPIASYPANGYSNSIFGNPGIPGNPFGTFGTNSLNNIYGNVLGPYLTQFLNSGAGYNPQVLQALINQIQPQVQTGLATLGATAGATGNRYGSAYQVGTADYLSQVNQNELGMASGLYENSINNVMNILSPLSTLEAQNRNNQGGFWTSLLSSLIPTAGSVISNIWGNGSGSSSGGGGIGGILGTIFGHGSPSGGGGNGPSLNIPGTNYPLPGTNENWGGTYTPTPPAGGTTGIPGGQIAGDAGNALLNYINQNFNPSPGSNNPLSVSQMEQVLGLSGTVPFESVPSATGDIPYNDIGFFQSLGL